MRTIDQVDGDLANLRPKMAEVRNELQTLEAVSRENDGLTEGQEERLERQLKHWDDLFAQEKALDDEKTQAIASRAAQIAKVDKRRAAGSVSVESGDGGKALTTRSTTRSTFHGDPWESRSDPGSFLTNRGGELRGRAYGAIEAAAYTELPDDFKERATAILDAADPDTEDGEGIARHMAVASDPEYLTAFKKYLRDPVRGPSLWTDTERQAVAAVQRLSERAMNEGTTAAGQALVPAFLDPTVILNNTGVSNPFRSIATVTTISTQTWKGVTSAGVTAEWATEAQEATDASPTFAQPSITPVRADAYVQASFEVFEDSAIGTDLAEIFADARDRLEGTAFATGTGSTQPYGIVTRLQTTTASRVSATTNGAYGVVDVFALDNNLPQRWRANASWLANRSVLNATRQFASGSGPQFAFWTDMPNRAPSTLIGYPTYESSAMFNMPLSTATASNDDIMVLADFRQYRIVDRIGMFVIHNPLVLGANRRPTGEVGWLAFWRTSGDLINTDAGRLLRV